MRNALQSARRWKSGRTSTQKSRAKSGATLWNEDYEEIDLQNRKEEFALIVALGKAELSGANGCACRQERQRCQAEFPICRSSIFASAASMARAIQVLANYVSAFEGCNKNLKS